MRRARSKRSGSDGCCTPKEGLAFEQSIQAARDAGLLPPRLRVALDSSPVRGCGAVKDAFNLLSDAIAAVVRAVAKKQTKTVEAVASQTALARHVAAPSVKGSEVVDWNDQSSVGSFLRGLLDDCERAAALARSAKCASEELALLEKVIAQDVERGQDGTARIRQGVTPDRTVSVHDPESRHGHKSSGKGYTGHKAHVAVDTDSGVVTATTVTAPSGSEGSQVEALAGMTRALTGSEIAGAVGDSASSTRDGLAAAEAESITLTTKMPGPPHGKLGPNDFTVSDDGEAARCPAGNSSLKWKFPGGAMGWFEGKSL